jgi:hypothetical protein
LKHLVINAPEDIRTRVFDGLGASFLSQLLMGDAPAPKSYLPSANALGERIDLLNDDPPFMDVDSHHTAGSDDDTDSSFLQGDIQTHYGPAKEVVIALQAFKRSHENAPAQSRKETIRIQHHSLDIIRNIIGDPKDNLIPGLIDKIINGIGQARFFEIILSKLRPISSAPPSLFAGPSSSSRTFHDPPARLDPALYPHVDLIKGALTVLVHIANGRASQRQMLISTPQLLQTMSTHFTHPDPLIRSSCCWIVHNLLWIENGHDKASARERARELKNAGMLDRCRIAYEDEVLDVKERAKSCLEAFSENLGEAAGVPGYR